MRNPDADHVSRPRIGIICGLDQEADWLLAGPQRSPAEAEIVVAGMGPHRAAEAARGLVAAGIRALISWGSAAGLDPALSPGAVVLPRYVVSAAGSILDPEEPWRLAVAGAMPGSIAVSSGLLAEAATVLATVEAKLELGRRTGAVAADMESAAIAAVAAESGIPWIAVRAIADTAGDPLPRAVLDNIGEDGTIDASAVLRTAATSFRQIRRLIHLGRHHARAGRAMRRVAQVAGGPLLEHGKTGDAIPSSQESP